MSETLKTMLWVGGGLVAGIIGTLAYLRWMFNRKD